jgi:hypothetical protein
MNEKYVHFSLFDGIQTVAFHFPCDCSTDRPTFRCLFISVFQPDLSDPYSEYITRPLNQNLKFFHGRSCSDILDLLGFFLISTP